MVLLSSLGLLMVNLGTYDPLFTSMYKKHLVAPFFSLAISRPTPGIPDGYLALGGLAPVARTGSWASVPLEYVQIGAGYQNSSLPFPQYRKHPSNFSYFSLTFNAKNSIL